MASEEVYNLVALAGLLFGKAVLFFLIIYYCCKRRESNGAEGADGATAADAATDLPPTYSTVVLKTEPPEYLDSILNEELNPEINKEWAVDLEKGAVDPEVAEVIVRSRSNSMAHSHRRREGGEESATEAAQQRASPVGAYWIGVL